MDGGDGQQRLEGSMREKEKRKSMRNVFVDCRRDKLLQTTAIKKGIDLRASLGWAINYNKPIDSFVTKTM